MSQTFGTEEVLHLLNASRTNKTESTCIVRVAQRKASAVYPSKFWGCVVINSKVTVENTVKNVNP